MHRAHPLRGYLYIAAAAFLWGIAATLGRAAFTGRLLPRGQSFHEIDPLILSQCRVTFSLVVLAVALIAGRGPRRLKLPWPDFARLCLLGIFGVAASNYLYYLAIQRTNVATAIILQYTAPVWVLLYAVIRGNQKATLQKLSAVLLAMTGIALVIGLFSGGFRLDKKGVIAALLAAFSFAFYNVGGHDLLERYDRWIVLLYALLSASLLWVVVDPPWKIISAHYAASQWLFLFVFSMISVLAAFSFYFAGLQHLEPTRAVVVSCLEPVFSIVIAAIALGEVLRPQQMLGIMVVLAGIMVVQWPERNSQSSVTIEPVD